MKKRYIQLGLFGEDEVVEAAPPDEYEAFVEKFKPKKTTDDCFTPPKVYEAVLQWVRGTWDIPEDTPVLRPFFPGGDYAHAHYPGGCVVIDNPPFSILSKIRRFYMARGIRYFLFAPALTTFFSVDDTNIVTASNVVYENGANVKTNFVTNLPCEWRVWVCPELAERVKAAQARPCKKLPKIVWPPEVIMSARLGKIAEYGIRFTVAKGEAVFTGKLDCGKILFGSGFLISGQAARRYAEARRQADEANAESFQLSPRERRIVEELGNSQKL